jgi:Spy/CpxP family protein refolding chaperone
MIISKHAAPVMLIVVLFGISQAAAQDRRINADSEPDNSTSIPAIDMQVISRGLAILQGMPSVVESLDIQDYQREQIKEIRSAYQKQMGSAAKAQARSTAEERRQAYQDVFKELDKKISNVLLPNQATRLKQIAVQSFSISPDGSTNLPNLLSLSYVQRELGLTSLELNEIRKNAVAEKKRLAEEIARLRQESQDRLLNGLTPEQRNRLDDLMGQPFDFEGYSPGRRGQFRKADDDH